jgi:hypothetical protein
VCTVAGLTELKMLLRHGQQLRNARNKRFAMDKISAPEQMLTDEEGEDIDKMGI